MYPSLPIQPTAKGHSRIYCRRQPAVAGVIENPPLERHREPSAMLRGNKDRTERRCTRLPPLREQKGFHATSWCCDVQSTQNHCRQADSSNGTTQRKNKRQPAPKTPSRELAEGGDCSRPAIPRDRLTQKNCCRATACEHIGGPLGYHPLFEQQGGVSRSNANKRWKSINTFQKMNWK